MWTLFFTHFSVTLSCISRRKQRFKSFFQKGSLLYIWRLIALLLKFSVNTNQHSLWDHCVLRYISGTNTHTLEMCHSCLHVRTCHFMIRFEAWHTEDADSSPVYCKHHVMFAGGDRWERSVNGIWMRCEHRERLRGDTETKTWKDRDEQRGPAGRRLKIPEG